MGKKSLLSIGGVPSLCFGIITGIVLGAIVSAPLMGIIAVVKKFSVH